MNKHNMEEELIEKIITLYEEVYRGFLHDDGTPLDMFDIAQRIKISLEE